MINPHPGLPEFEYIQPSSIKDASKFLADHEGEARPFAGGTDCFVRMRDGVLKLKYLVDVKKLEGATDLSFSPQVGLTIGAAVTMNQITAHPEVIRNYSLLSEAARSVASYQLRNRATLIGNICNASPAGDTIGACLILNGILNVYGIAGKRQIPLAAFFLNPGRTILKPGDIVLSISLPIPPKGSFGVYKKLGRNTISDLSIVGVSVLGYPQKESPSGYRFRVALASVAPVPFEAYKAEAALSARFINEEVISEASQIIMDTITPIDDVRSSARYRKFMARNLAKEAITEVWTALKKQSV